MRLGRNDAEEERSFHRRDAETAQRNAENFTVNLCVSSVSLW